MKMDTGLLQKFRSNLSAHRQHLVSWLGSAPEEKKQVQLGSTDEANVRARVQVLDDALERTRTKSFGRCDVCHEPMEPDRLEMDYTCCVCLDHLSSDEKREIENELQLAAKFQQALLPQDAPAIPGLDVAAYSRPAAVIGGDYFGFYRFQDGAHGLAIGDAVGHGISASLLMSNLHAALQILVPEHNTPVEVIQRLNHLFHHNINLTNFVTLFLARYEPENRTLTYSSAGHNPPLLGRARPGGEDSVAWLKPTGPAIGLVEDFATGTAQVSLSPGDVLLLYTDGVTEAISARQEPFGDQRLAELVRRSAHMSAQELVGAVREGLGVHVQGHPLADDTTIVALKGIGD
jgi:sigma-B regulation protein RsbU (phosphoserine phosphatase)